MNLIKATEEIMDGHGYCKHEEYMVLVDTMQSIFNPTVTYRVYKCEQCDARFAFYKESSKEKWIDFGSGHVVTENFIYDED